MADVITEIAEERRRQVEDEGFDADHDIDHDKGELAKAAMAYCQSGSIQQSDTSVLAGHPPTYWPWDRKWWKPKNKRRDLIRAAALIVAEIERLDAARDHA